MKDCGCQPEVEIKYKKCNQCITEPCTCAVKDLSTDCVLFTGDDIQCEGTTVITKNLNLSDNLKNLVAYICQKFSDIQNYLRIINVGGGSQIYAGDNLLGQKKLRTLTSEDDSVLVTQNTDTIDFSVIIPEPELQNLQSVLDVGNFATQGNTTYSFANNGAEIISSQNILGFVNSSILRTPPELVQLSNYYSENGGSNSIQGQFNVDNGKAYIRQNIDGFTSGRTIIVGFQDPLYNVNLLFPAKTIDGTFVIATVDQIPTVDGSETKINQGTNITITGNGTTATPYVINSTTPDGSETKINNGLTTTVSGNGTIATPYILETKNLQKIIPGANYVLSNADNNYVVFINNASTDITITVPTGLTAGFQCGFMQQGMGIVTFVNDVGVTINTPTGLKIQGQNYDAFIEKVLATEVYHLSGDIVT